MVSVAISCLICFLHWSHPVQCVLPDDGLEGYTSPNKLNCPPASRVPYYMKRGEKKKKRKKKPAEVKSACLTSEKEFLPIQLQISCIEKKQAINCYPILLSASNKTPKPSDSGQMSSNHTVTEIQFYLKCLNWAGFVKWNIHVINEIQFHNIPFKTL